MNGRGLIVMRWLCRLRGRAFWLALFLLLLAVGCLSPAEPRTNGSSEADQHQVPFQDSESPQGKVSPAESEIAKAEASLPFDSQGLPAGVFLTVLLRDPIQADSPGASGTFDAVIDEPVVIEGTTLLPRGASVAGRVESAHASRLKRNRGYLQLTLASIAIADQDIPIQTSSLFVSGTASDIASGSDDSSPRTIRVESGRRLTFRLAEPVLLASRAAVRPR